MKDPPVAPPVQSTPLVQSAKSAPLQQPAPIVQAAGAPQIQYVTYEVHGPTSQRQDNGFGTVVRTLGIIALSLMVVGFIPCFGWLNYLNIFVSFITIIIGIVAIASGKSDADRTAAFLGVAFVVLAIFVGTGRLIIGGGCL
jgi:hypothetical protein